MERVQWLERSLRLLAKHYARSMIVQFVSDGLMFDCQLLVRSFTTPGGGELIGEGATLADAVEAGIGKLTDEQILAAEALLPAAVES